MAMLRDGLRAELPELFALASRVRPVSMVEMPPWLTAIAALGIRSLTDQLLRGALAILLSLTGLQVRTFEAVTVVANAVAILLAFGSARWRGVAAAVALFGVLWLEQMILAVPGVRTFCERNGSSDQPQFCDLAVRVFSSLWPIVAGVAVGLVLRRVVRQGAQGKAVLLIAVGVSALVYPVVRLLVAPTLGVFWHGSYVPDAVSAILITQVVGAVGLGGLAGYFGRRHLLDGVVIAAYYLLPWIPLFEAWRRNVPRPFIFEVDWQFFAPVGYAVGALVALVVAALIRQLRRTLLDAYPGP